MDDVEKAKVMLACGELRIFVVYLHEDQGDKFRLYFRCYAEDADHAVEQAENAYPGSVALHVFQTTPAEEQ